ncbi:MAG: chromate transporter [Eubacteriales bacterium]|nr:chromate transporter [Eubacteriales bacterium]MDD3883026.1 chromate transporter [Eubacteriales bacterium]MDD4513647.1 chromate transporter [Eubacteriales bacterium]
MTKNSNETAGNCGRLFLSFLKIGAFTFGGGYAMLSLIGHECVERRQWLTEEEMTELTVIAESTPGPVAINAATYTGCKTAGIKGAVAATLGMVLPSFVIILIISALLSGFMDIPIVAKAFRGIRVAVALLIISAALRMLKTLMKNKERRAFNIVMIAVFGALLLSLSLLSVSFSTVYLILLSGAIGFFALRGSGKGGSV